MISKEFRYVFAFSVFVPKCLSNLPRDAPGALANGDGDLTVLPLNLIELEVKCQTT